jgi:multisite-specific tRNA:(cytosine-C5)-methyltransferase
MVFPLWKSVQSLNLMLPKEDRKALLLRLFNDETPLVNLSQKNTNGSTPQVEVKVESRIDSTDSIEQKEDRTRRNSSSEEELDEGGVPIIDGTGSTGGTEARSPAGKQAEDVTPEPSIL